MEIDRKMRNRLRDLPDPLKTVDIQNFLGLSKNSAYNLVNEKQFHVLEIGRLKLIPKQSFVKWYMGKLK